MRPSLLYGSVLAVVVPHMKSRARRAFSSKLRSLQIRARLDAGAMEGSRGLSFEKYEGVRLVRSSTFAASIDFVVSAAVTIRIVVAVHGICQHCRRHPSCCQIRRG